MVNEFRLPDIGEGLTDAEVVTWHVAVGDVVTVDQLLVEVETAKAIVEITSPYAGVVLHLGAAEGEDVAVGAILLVIGEAGEIWSADGAAASDVGPVAEAAAASPPADTARPGRVKAVPIVRKLARDRGVDLSTITGTGPAGAITRDDVLGAAEGGTTEPTAAASDERVTMSRLRRTIAENMTRSWREIPHVTAQADLDASRLLAAHRDLRQRTGRPIPLEALVAQAVIPSLREYPEFNATLDGSELILKRRYDLGFAVDTEEGLVVVVTRGTDIMGPETLADRIRQLAERPEPARRHRTTWQARRSRSRTSARSAEARELRSSRGERRPSCRSDALSTRRWRGTAVSSWLRSHRSTCRTTTG